MSKDYCTGFFENWVRWKKPSWKGFALASLYAWEVFALSELCKANDEKCSTHTFLNLLKDNRVVGGFLIGTSGVLINVPGRDGFVFFTNPTSL